MRVVRLKPYLRAMGKMGFDDAGMRAVETVIVAAPQAHPVIPGLRGVRKAHFARPGGGKSGRRRVIYYVALASERLFMMSAYPKNERDDLSSAQKKAILTAIESIKGDQTAERKWDPVDARASGSSRGGDNESGADGWRTGIPSRE